MCVCGESTPAALGTDGEGWMERGFHIYFWFCCLGRLPAVACCVLIPAAAIVCTAAAGFASFLSNYFFWFMEMAAFWFFLFIPYY